MHLANTTNKYGIVARYLHWIIAILVVFILTLGIFMDDIPAPYHSWWVSLHKSVGILILFLAIIRLGWRLFNKIPAPPKAASWELALARFSHGAFYFLLLATPVVGWAMSTIANHSPNIFWLATVDFPALPPGGHELSHWLKHVHKYLAYIFIFLIVLHVLGALKNHFIAKNKVLRRMLSGKD